MLETKPTKDQVLKEFAKHSKLHAQKAKYNLAVHLRGEKCYCIEGIFCEVAAQLGFPGEYVPKDATSAIYQFHYKLKNPKAPEASVESIAPEEIWDFLGLPKTVKNKFVMGLGKRYADALAISEFPVHMTNPENSSKWYQYNDSTNLTIPELLKVAEKLLEQGSV